MFNALAQDRIGLDVPVVREAEGIHAGHERPDTLLNEVEWRQAEQKPLRFTRECADSFGNFGRSEKRLLRADVALQLLCDLWMGTQFSFNEDGIAARRIGRVVPSAEGWVIDCL